MENNLENEIQGLNLHLKRKKRSSASKKLEGFQNRYFIDRAKLEDVDSLLQLYQIVYGPTYPLDFGTQPDVARKLVQSQTDRWYVTRELETGKPIASVVFDVDSVNKIGKCVGLVVHPDHRGSFLATRMVEVGTNELLTGSSGIRSIYTTTRTNSIGPQMIFLKTGYLAMGIFPNAHRLKSYETLTLFVKYRDGVLANRKVEENLSSELKPILGILEQRSGMRFGKQFGTMKTGVESAKPGDLEFEFIFAPAFVQRRFENSGADEYDRFYPFQKPNFLMVSKNGEVEIFAYFSKKDRHCAIVSVNVPIYTLAGRLSGLLDQLKELGVAYLELLLGIQYGASIEVADSAGFIPSAVYPAMRMNPEGHMEDFVILSRTLEPLDFRGMSVDESFEPFVQQYVTQWTKKAIQSLEIFHGSR